MAIQQVFRDTGHTGHCTGEERIKKKLQSLSLENKKPSVVLEYLISYQTLPWAAMTQVEYNLLDTMSSSLGEPHIN